MTDFNNNNKYVPNAPKTYEQFVLDNQFEQNQTIADSYAAELDAYSDISIQKGYGPCHSCGNKNLRFRLQITLKNINGAYITGTVYSTNEAERAAQQIICSTGF